MEELEQILSNEEMTVEEKKEAVNKFIGTNYVPSSKYADKMAEAKSKYELLESDFDAFKASKMTEEEKRAEAEKLQKQKFQEQSQDLSRYIVKDIFTTNGLEVKDDIVNSLIQGTPETTKIIAENVAELLKAQKESLSTNFKETLKTQVNKPASGNATEPSKQETELEALQNRLNDPKTTPVERAGIMRQMNAIINK